MDSRTSVFLTKVKLVNFRSIARCDVSLGPLMYLVGRNGAGKSNFLDAVRFVADGLRSSLDHALRDRGGIKEVRRRSSGHPTHFEMRFEFVLSDGRPGMYAFRIGAKTDGRFTVQSEECRVLADNVFEKADFHYLVKDGVIETKSAPIMPPPSSDRLYLVNASGLPEFRPVYDAFSRMAFYNLSPAAIRDLQSPDAGDLLSRDGSNLASVFARISSGSPDTKRRIEEYLGTVVPGIEGVSKREIGPKETLEFLQQVRGSDHPWHFLAANMSDGTLRALGIVTALFQNLGELHRQVSLVAIEEPEVALHPAAAGILRDVLAEASATTQVLVTSHSPDLLDDKSIVPDSIISVSKVRGDTVIQPIGVVSREAIKRELYTAGELLRQDKLVSDEAAYESTTVLQPKLLDIEAQ